MPVLNNAVNFNTYRDCFAKRLRLDRLIVSIGNQLTEEMTFAIGQFLSEPHNKSTTAKVKSLAGEDGSYM